MSELQPGTKTASRVKVSYTKATFWMRLFAYMIDSTLILVVAALIIEIQDASPKTYSLVTTFIYLVYNIVMDYGCQGTLGKRMLNLRVITIDGKHPGLMTCVTRNVGKIISALPLYYGFFRILAPHQRQTIHDEIAHCLVVKVEREKRPKTPAGNGPNFAAVQP